jgi:DNA-binding response OmpR family regulator
MKVLIIDDYQPLAKSLAKGLREEALAVDLAFDGEEGNFLAENNDYDVIILDLLLPKIDGLSLLKKWREKGLNTPVLILTALDAPEQVVQGLEVGADDYLVKPFHFEELLARVRALIRRKFNRQNPVLKVADLEIDTRSKRVKRGGKDIILTAKEYALLEYLARRANEIVSRQELWEHAYDWAAEINSNVLDVHIYNLRQKIDRPFKVKLLKTIKGLGLILSEGRKEKGEPG